MTHVPDVEAAVNRLAERVAPVSHTALYGTTFHVRSEKNPKNIAYSSQHIPLHMDLSYYESPPGIQLLHCRAFNAVGGASLLLDVHSTVVKLNKTNPSAFEALTRLAASRTHIQMGFFFR